MLRRFIGFLSLIALFSCQNQNTNDELTRLEAQADRVEILRDDFGVPHIYGKTDADAVFGLLYAQCEDDFRRVERNYVWAIGRLAELEGEEAIYSDLRANLYMTEAEAKAAYETAPDWLKELCVAFADGVNYYLHTHPEANPQVITRYEPWMPMFFFEGSIGGDIESIATGGIKAFYEGNKALAFAQPLEELLTEPQGSNGIAIAPSLTESGNAMLLINPHTSFYFRPEVHVVSEEGLNVYGAVTWGQFFVYQGFNEKTGWIHTSTFVDFKDEFEEEIVESEGKIQYKYG
jgi:acyl-homoserine-lactone acylase